MFRETYSRWHWTLAHCNEPVFVWCRYQQALRSFTLHTRRRHRGKHVWPSLRSTAMIERVKPDPIIP